MLGPILFVLYASLVSDIINYHSLHHESFVDDTRLHESAHITELDQLISKLQDCITDLKSWMIHNKLQLSDDKTELMLATPKKVSQLFFSPSFYADQSSQYLFFSIRSQPRCRSRPNIVFQAACLEHLQSSIPGAPHNQYHSPLSFCSRNQNPGLCFCPVKNRVL